jgi:hypothetical protein
MTSNNGDRRTQQSRKESISDLLSQIEKKVKAEIGKVTIADYVRVIQLERELEEEEQVQPRALKVTWIEPSETYDFEE